MGVSQRTWAKVEGRTAHWYKSLAEVRDDARAALGDVEPGELVAQAWQTGNEDTTPVRVWHRSRNRSRLVETIPRDESVDAVAE